MSKLQALAAARKKKAQEQRGGGDASEDKSLASLHTNKHSPGEEPGAAEAESTKSTLLEKPPPRGFPLRKRKVVDEHDSRPKAPVATEDREPNLPPNLPPSPEDIPFARQVEPSSFASTMFSSSSQPARKAGDNLFTLPTATVTASTAANPFAGPSPDDIVIAAQSKGSTISIRPRN